MEHVQNHRGATMELGEGLYKLNLADDGHDVDSISWFQYNVAIVLQFLYRTQKELATCTYARANLTTCLVN
jgi:hypothetical protein